MDVITPSTHWKTNGGMTRDRGVVLVPVRYELRDSTRLKSNPGARDSEQSPAGSYIRDARANAANSTIGSDEEADKPIERLGRMMQCVIDVPLGDDAWRKRVLEAIKWDQEFISCSGDTIPTVAGSVTRSAREIDELQNRFRVMHHILRILPRMASCAE
jgi:hypothetical protein